MDKKKETSSPKNTLYKKTFKLLIIGKKHFFLYQLFFALIAFLVLTPVWQVVTKMAKKSAGYSYITQENLLDFMTRPVTLLAIVILFLIAGLLILVEISLVFSFLMVGKNLESKSSILIFFGSIRKAFRCFLKKNFAAVFLSYGMALLSGAGVIYVTCTRGRIPKYMIKTFHAPVIGRIILCAGILLILYAFFRNIFTLPYFLLENRNIKEGRKNTEQLLKGHMVCTVFQVLLWNVGIWCVSALLYFLIIVTEALFVILFVDHATSVAVFLTLYEHINVYAGLGLTWFSLYCNLGLITELFLRYKKINDEEFYSESIKVTSRFLTDKRKRAIAFGMALILFLLDGMYTYGTVKRGNRSLISGMSQIVITAHRGSSSDAPENTLPAIEAAIRNTADVAEIDVQETKDGEVVVLHDSSLKRTSGCNKFIWDVTFDEVRQLDMGSWFSSDFAGTQIPTLEEVLQVCQGKIKLNIELKTSSHFSDLEDKVVALIEKYGFTNQCVVQSTDYNALSRVKKLNEDITTGYILMAAYGDFQDKGNIDFFSIRSSFVNKKMVESAHKNGKEVYAWTVNTKNEIRRMKVLKVDNIITDRPILARELVYKENFDSTFSSLFKLLKQ